MPRVRIGELELFHTTDGAGEPVLLLMGLGGEHRAWDLVRRELARRYRLVLVDNRDAGASDEANRPYGTGDMAADALGVIDHLGIERFHVVGASMGGAIAQHLALLAPTRVATLVLIGSWARTDAFLRTILTGRSEEHTSELQSRLHLVCRLLLETKNGLTTTRRGPAAAGLGVLI